MVKIKCCILNIWYKTCKMPCTALHDLTTANLAKKNDSILSKSNVVLKKSLIFIMEQKLHNLLDALHGFK